MTANDAADRLRSYWTEAGMIETFGPDFELAMAQAYKQGWNDGIEEQMSEVNPMASERSVSLSKATTMTEAEPRTAADLPPRIAVDDKGNYWRDYLDHYSMPPVSENNEPVEVVAYYVRLQGKPIEAEARAGLDAAALRSFFRDHQWSIHMEDTGDQPLDPFAAIAAAYGGQREEGRG